MLKGTPATYLSVKLRSVTLFRGDLSTGPPYTVFSGRLEAAKHTVWRALVADSWGLVGPTKLAAANELVSDHREAVDRTAVERRTATAKYILNMISECPQDVELNNGPSTTSSVWVT